MTIRTPKRTGKNRTAADDRIRAIQAQDMKEKVGMFIDRVLALPGERFALDEENKALEQFSTAELLSLRHAFELLGGWEEPIMMILNHRPKEEREKVWENYVTEMEALRAKFQQEIDSEERK